MARHVARPDRRAGSRLLGRLRMLAITLSMVLCSILFLPWAYPRETLSGLVGRWLIGNRAQRAIARPLAWIIDRCVHDPIGEVSCGEIARLEALSRAVFGDHDSC